MRLYYSPASPYARIARIVAAERDLPLELIAETGFPPERVLPHNPAMQVPLLVTDEGPLFGTRLIVEYLMALPPGVRAGRAFLSSPTRREHHWRDAQILTALETLLNSLVNRSYLIWTGVEHRADAPITLDLAERELVRSLRLLDWLEDQATQAGFLEGGFSLQDVWLISTLAWTDAREQIPWRGRPKIEAIVHRNAERPSLQETAPPGSPRSAA